MKNDDIDFIARHYRKGRFNADAGWHRLGIATVSRWKRYRVAAAVAVAVVVSAAAAIIYHEYRAVDLPEPTVVAPAGAVSPLAEIKVIDFENASLTEVVKRIEEVYNVRVENLPDNDEAYELSLHYEGTPTDLIGVINDLLGTQMTVAEK